MGKRFGMRIQENGRKLRCVKMVADIEMVRCRIDEKASMVGF